MTQTETLRALFELPDDLAYLDAGFMTPLPRVVRAAGEAGVAAKSSPWRLTRASLYQEVEELRQAAAILIGAAADDIAVVGSTAYGIGTAAANLPLPSGEVVLTMAGEHPSQVLPWLEATARGHALHEELPQPEDGDWTRAVLERLRAPAARRVAVLALTAVHWSDGASLDLPAIGAAACAAGAALVLDGTQSVGVRPLDVREVRPDFLAFAPYKWLLGPYGIGLLYAAPHRQHGRPLEQHAFSRLGADRLHNHYGRELRFMDGARRYDMGQRGNLVTVPMTLAALRLVAELGVAASEARIRPLTDRLAEGARELGFRAPPIRAAHLLGLRADGLDAAAGIAALREAGVIASAREGALRFGVHVYNTEAEIDRALSALHLIRPTRARA